MHVYCTCSELFNVGVLSGYVTLPFPDSSSPEPQNVPPGFPAVDQSYNAEEYYRGRTHLSTTRLGGQQQQFRKGVSMVSDTRQLGTGEDGGGSKLLSQSVGVGHMRQKKTPVGGVISGRRGTRQVSSSSVSATKVPEWSQSTERRRPLIGRPSILDNIVDLEDDNEEEEEEEEDEEKEEVGDAGKRVWSQGVEAVDSGHGQYDMQQLVPAQSSGELCLQHTVIVLQVVCPGRQGSCGRYYNYIGYPVAIIVIIMFTIRIVL